MLTFPSLASPHKVPKNDSILSAGRSVTTTAAGSSNGLPCVAAHDRSVLEIGAGGDCGVCTLVSTVAPDRGPRRDERTERNPGGDEDRPVGDDDAQAEQDAQPEQERRRTRQRRAAQVERLERRIAQVHRDS